MISRRNISALLIFATLMVAGLSTASADEPWSPIKPNPTKQITDGVFTQSPLMLPFEQISVEMVTPDSAQPSQDFEHVYNASYDEVIAYFTTEDAKKNGVAAFDPKIFPESKGLTFRAGGIQEERNGTQFRLTNRKSSRDLLVLVEPRGNRTVVTFKNIVLTKLSSGVMPARQGFIGMSFKEVLSFSWN